MAFSDNFSIEKLLEGVKNLFQGRANPTQSSGTTRAPASGSYQSPIKANWYNSGGFDTSGALRPNGRRGHSGVDMRAPGGTPVYPMASGIVTGVGTDPLGGNVVNIQHADGVRTYYAHLSTVKVQRGDRVGTNTIIGAVGDTGNAKGTVPHCHFQVWKDNQLQDPARYFPVPPYTNLTAEERRQGPWLSERAKQEAAAFNMKEHVQKQRVAFSKDVDTLVVYAEQFSAIVSGQSKK